MLKTLMAKLSLTAVAVALSITANAIANPPANIDIPAGELVEALKSLSTQSDVELVYRPEQLREVRTPGIKGTYTPRQAIDILLKGTPLRVFTSPSGAMVIAPPAPPTKASGEALRGPTPTAPAQASSRIRLAQESTDESGTSSDTTELRRLSLEEIIVTAQKREERLQDVPISISVLDGVELDKFTGEGTLEQLALVPGVSMAQDYRGGAAQLSMRGVTAAESLFNGSSPVGYYLDTVPFGLVKSSIVPDSNAYDLERIEVLRGPQGTLYGASALNGVVRVLTRDADLNRFELKTRLTAATTEKGGESYRGDLAANLPIVEGKLAVRAAAGYNDAAGWIDRPFERDANDAQLRNARLRINAQPTEQLSIGLSAWSSRSDYGGAPISDNDDVYPGEFDQPIEADFDALGLKVGYDFSGFSITSMTSHVDYLNHGVLDASYFGLDLFATHLDSKVLSQEILLNSTSEGGWRWSLGGFYRDAEDRLLQTWDVVLPAPIDFSDTSESFALFGEATRILLDGQLELTAGLRYFEDEVTQIENAPFDGDLARPLIRDTSKFEHVSPRLVLAWHPTAGTTFYGSYSEGFRSGFNQNANILLIAPELAPVKEDKLRNYEVGAKGNLLGGMLAYDAAVYFIDWQDVQQTLCVSIAGGATCVTALINGESASGLGLDLAAILIPTDGLKLGASFSWNDLSMDGDVSSGGILLFDKGDRLNSSSEITVGASVGYHFPVGTGGLEAGISLSGTYNSERPFVSISGPSRVANPGDSLVNTRASLSVSAADRWSTSLYVDNASNERGSPYRIAGADVLSSRLRPRTMGIQFDYRY